MKLDALAPRYDLIIVGGGITGAGILREAVRTGAKALLVEQNDFASGTSSGSSKLVHGGLRYLKNGQWRLTLESVRERQLLLDQAPGLVDPQPFIMPLYRGMKPGPFVMRLGLKIYDRMGGASTSRWVSADEALKLEPGIRSNGLLGALLYDDARTDDTRLVLRLILESLAEGGAACSYTRVTSLLKSGERVQGVALRDEAGLTREIEAGVVVNATGAWADGLPGAPQGAPALRPLRGSHFVFPHEKLPVARSVSWLHPKDRRPIFAYPWKGATLYGTTDLDHGGADLAAPRMSREEAAYLLEGLAHQFPRAKLSARDALSTYSGVRPVVAGGKGDPSAESRESALWQSPGLVGITGGKLTTFRVTARQVLAAAAKQDSALAPKSGRRVFEATAGASRLAGRFGGAVTSLTASANAAERMPLDATPYSLAELRWSARHEQVRHLDDLLLRRTRIGLVAPRGGEALLERVGAVCREELGWEAAKWSAEVRRYQELWQQRHDPGQVA